MPDTFNSEEDDGYSDAWQPFDEKADYGAGPERPVMISSRDLARMQKKPPEEMNRDRFEQLLKDCRNPNEVMELAARVGLPTSWNRLSDFEE